MMEILDSYETFLEKHHLATQRFSRSLLLFAKLNPVSKFKLTSQVLNGSDGHVRVSLDSDMTTVSRQFTGTPTTVEMGPNSPFVTDRFIIESTKIFFTDGELYNVIIVLMISNSD